MLQMDFSFCQQLGLKYTPIYNESFKQFDLKILITIFYSAILF